MDAAPVATSTTRKDDTEDLAAQLRHQKRKLRTLTTKKNAVWHMLCCIFALVHPDTAPVTAYIARHSDDIDYNDGELEEALRQWYDQAQSNLSLQATLNPTRKSQQRQHRAAVKFVKEWRLHHWVEAANLEKAVAPTASMLCQPGGPPGIEHTAIPFLAASTQKHRSKLQWLRRWRRRWNVQLGKFAPGERISTAAAQNKVRVPPRPPKKNTSGRSLHPTTRMRPQKQGHEPAPISDRCLEL